VVNSLNTHFLLLWTATDLHHTSQLQSNVEKAKIGTERQAYVENQEYPHKLANWVPLGFIDIASAAGLHHCPYRSP
jgi:hypothetical protein